VIDLRHPARVSSFPVWPQPGNHRTIYIITGILTLFYI
jgi:hypothetical protein